MRRAASLYFAGSGSSGSSLSFAQSGLILKAHKSGQASPAHTEEATMASRSGFVFAAALVAGVPAPPSAFAQFASPQALIDDIYRTHYRTRNSPGLDLGRKSVVVRYFEPALADAIDKDGRGDQEPRLNGDPFTNSQDRHFSGLKIDMGAAGERAATATVSFLREGDRKRTVLRFDLAKDATGWRIRDIVESGGDAPIDHAGSLRRLLKIQR
jgi:hypothetical protein